MLDYLQRTVGSQSAENALEPQVQNGYAAFCRMGARSAEWSFGGPFCRMGVSFCRMGLSVLYLGSNMYSSARVRKNTKKA